jgi:hypothetical protein
VCAPPRGLRDFPQDAVVAALFAPLSHALREAKVDMYKKEFSAKNLRTKKET